MNMFKAKEIAKQRGAEHGGVCSFLANSIRRAWAPVAIAAALTAVPVAQAYANPLEDLGNWFSNAGTAVAEFFGIEMPDTGSLPEKYQVDTIEDLQGTTVNLFDYWASTDVYENPDANDYKSYGSSDENLGINRNPETGENRTLQFSAGVGTAGGINKWTGNKNPYGWNSQNGGVVLDTLQDGYPVLNPNAIDGPGWNDDPSLAYLFDESQFAGKRSFMDVKGLFQVDDEGYYYYKSGNIGDDGQPGNYAEFDPKTMRFHVYDTSAVNYETADGYRTEGMFFPFTPASTVMKEDRRGQSLIPNTDDGRDYAGNAGATQAGLNHYFGLTMTTRFLQQPNGQVNNGTRDVEYTFTGDDDVWVFIDDVLVGDLGGIHDAATLSINFHTGDILINGNDAGTIREKFDEAGKPGTDKNWGEDIPGTGWWDPSRRSETFADNTFHTLKFFYLERGNVASNMHLKTNLVTTPETTVEKVDQDGTPVPGVDFSLYAADENYNVPANAEAICSGTTDRNGTLTLRRGDEIITFDRLHDEGHNYFVLKEDLGSERGGLYRKMGDMHLRYVSEEDSNNNLTTGFVVSDNYIETGAFANARETVIAPALENMRTAGDNGAITQTPEGEVDGTLFAVPLKFRGDASTPDAWANASNWAGVYGSSAEGWELGEGTGLGSAIAAAKAQGDSKYRTGPFTFELNSNVLYQVNIDELPGDIDRYYYALPDNQKGRTQYALAFYWTTADSVADAKVSNTKQIANNGFTRQFAAQLNVPNIYNDFVVQKVDQKGNPVNGATIGLFGADSVQKVDGVYQLAPNAQPIVTRETDTFTDSDGTTKFEGVAIFEGQMDVGGNLQTVLETGNYYYIAELAAPTTGGYERNENLVRVYVSDEGVFVDAGVEDDGIAVRRGVGRLVRTMDQFAENPAIEATLTDIVAELYTYTGEEVDQHIGLEQGWGAQNPKSLVHLNYNKNGVRQEYGPTDDDASPLLSADTDWARLKVTQCDEHDKVEGAYKEDLGDQNLSHLFSGLVVVEITNSQVNDLEISKTVNGYADMDATALEKLRGEKKFTFSASFEEPADYKDASKGYTALKDGYSVSILDKNNNPVKGEDGNAVTHEIKDGKVEFTLKHDQKAVVDDLPIEAKYTVEETAVDGFATSVDATGGTVDADNAAKVTGTLADSNAATPDEIDGVVLGYTNTFSVEPYGTEVAIPVEKSFVDDTDGASKWDDKSSFQFELRRQGDAPLPEGAKPGDTSVVVTVDNSSTQGKDDTIRTGQFTFAENTFTSLGTYKYYLSEILAVDALPGVYYSRARYEVIIDVTDGDGDGKAEVAVTYKKLNENDGAPSDPNAAATNATPAFENKYSKDSTNFTLNGRKHLMVNGTAVEAKDGEFEFKLTAVNGTHAAKPEVSAEQVPMPAGTAQGETSKTVHNDGYLVRFGGIEFDVNDLGYTYNYTIEEVQDTSKGYYTYDATKFDVAVTVTEQDGALKAAATYTPAAGTQNPDEHLYRGMPLFVNYYDADDAKLSISGTKNVTSDWTVSKADFEFTLASADGTQPDGVVTNLPVKATSNDSGAFTFADITFNKPGTYTFKVTESPRTTGGWHNDATPRTVVVKVTDNGQGALSAAVVAADSDELTFTNVYDASATASVRGQKTLTGRPFKSTDSFTFVVTGKAADGSAAPMPSNAMNGTYTIRNFGSASPNPYPLNFGTIAFDRPGTYTYTFQEQAPQSAVEIDGKKVLDGVTFDETKYEVVFTVEDGNNGMLNVTAKLNNGDGALDNTNTVNGLGWTNAYDAVMQGDADTTVEFTKVFTGRDWTENDNFKFTISSSDSNAPMPVDDAGNTVPEVTINGKDAKANADGSKGGTKEFSFGKLKFTMAMVADAPGRAKTFRYTVTEDSANPIPGVSYETQSATFDVRVADRGNGVLTATVQNVNNSTFTNTYETGSVDIDASSALQIVKKMTDRDIAAGDFAFTMTGVDEASQLKLNADKKPLVVESVPATMTNGVATSTTIANTDLVFSLSDAGKTYAYTIVENLPDGVTQDDDSAEGFQHDGVTYDRTEHKLTFKVTDAGEGVLQVDAYLGEVKADSTPVATWTSPDASGDPADVVSVEFNNSYNAGTVVVGGTEVPIVATKTLTGRPQVAGEFTFVVTNDKDKTDPKSEVLKGVGTAAESGKPGAITFDGKVISYNTHKLVEDAAAGLADKATVDGKTVYTYHYTMTEQNTAVDGVAPVKSSDKFTVTVTDDGEGNLSAAVEYDQGTAGMTFENVYGAITPWTLKISGTKIVESEADYTPAMTKIAEKYTFKLIGEGDAPMPAGNGATAKMDPKTGSIKFGDIEITSANMTGATQNSDGTQTKTFKYRVEESGTVPGITNGAMTPNEILVTVVDNGKGNLTATKSTEGMPHGDFFFKNTYRVDPQSSSVSDSFSFTKKLTGRDLKDGEFSFELKSTDGAFADSVVAKNDASGKITFPGLTFSKAGDYRFELREVNDRLGGVSYDDAVYTVVASVTDQGDGTLAVAWKFEGDNAPEGTDVVFENTYTAEGTEVKLGATKLLDGRAIKKGEFTFELREGDKVIRTAKNDAPNDDGSAPVTFDAISYDAPGEHTYTIAEVKGDDANVTYDTAVFTVHVSVVDNGSGELVATVTNDKDIAPVFKNVYNEPQKPGPDPKPEEPPTGGGDTDDADGGKEKLPGTGDASMLLAAPAALGAALTAAGWYAGKRRRNRL